MAEPKPFIEIAKAKPKDGCAPGVRWVVRWRNDGERAVRRRDFKDWNDVDDLVMAVQRGWVADRPPDVV